MYHIFLYYFKKKKNYIYIRCVWGVGRKIEKNVVHVVQCLNIEYFDSKFGVDFLEILAWGF